MLLCRPPQRQPVHTDLLEGDLPRPRALAALGSGGAVIRLARLQLERGRPQPGRAVSATAAADLVAWLPEDLRSPTAALLSSGHRLAQEWIGYQTLQANDRPSV